MSIPSTSLAFKPFFFEALYSWIIQNGKTPHLLINADSWGVQVPKHHIKDGRIVLNVEARAVREFLIDKERRKLTFLAKFDGKAQTVSIPVRAILAIYAIEDGLGWRFNDDTEGEGVHQNVDDLFEPKPVVKLSEEQLPQKPTKKKKPNAFSRQTASQLKANQTESDSDPDPGGCGKKAKAPWLKLVK